MLNWTKELAKALKKYWWVLLIFLLVIPFCINLLFKWHTGALLEWEDAAGAMLEFYGAVLGGGVTLLVLGITTDETRKIQKKNEQQLEDDRKERERERRKFFADSIADDVAKYLANTMGYKDSCLKIAECAEKIQSYGQRLIEVKRLLIERCKKIDSGKGNTQDITEKHQLEAEKEHLEDIIQAQRRNAEAYLSSRELAIEKLLLLNIKLNSVNGGKELVNEMQRINNLAEDDTVDFDSFVKEINSAINATSDFSEIYING